MTSRLGYVNRFVTSRREGVSPRTARQIRRRSRGVETWPALTQLAVSRASGIIGRPIEIATR